MNQIGKAAMMYAQDYDELLVPHRTVNTLNPFVGQFPANQANVNDRTFWNSLLMPYVKNLQVFKCPSNPNGWVGGDPVRPHLRGRDRVQGSRATAARTAMA